jgi:hypothetical protein
VGLNSAKLAIVELKDSWTRRTENLIFAKENCIGKKRPYFCVECTDDTSVESIPHNDDSSVADGGCHTIFVDRKWFVKFWQIISWNSKNNNFYLNLTLTVTQWIQDRLDVRLELFWKCTTFVYILSNIANVNNAWDAWYQIVLLKKETAVLRFTLKVIKFISHR